MADFHSLSQNYATHGAPVLKRLIRGLADSLGIPEGDEREGVLGKALAEAYMAGIDAGESEIMAQTVEQGYDAEIDKLRGGSAKDKDV